MAGTKHISYKAYRKTSGGTTKGKTKPQDLEHLAQCQVIQWAERHKQKHPALALLFAIPNGGKLPYKRTAKGKIWSPQRAKLVKEGLKPGVPDLFLPVPMPDNKGKIMPGLFIELKMGSNKPSAVQDGWIAALRAQGYDVRVCYGELQTISVLRSYLRLSDPLI